MKIKRILFFMITCLMVCGCSSKKEDQGTEEEVKTVGQALVKDTTTDTEKIKFVDAFGQQYEVKKNSQVKAHGYDLEKFVHQEDGKLTYSDANGYSSRVGIDVSYHNGKIDWKKIKEQGFEFAFIRIGYRGYGEEGVLKVDEEFEENIRGAKEAGLDVGVYFFAQAINEEEAKEEAEFVLKTLKGNQLELPIVYDPESILDDEARTDNVTGEQFTKNTITFCNAIREAGYEPMVYANMLWEAYQLDLPQLSDIPIWYADYEKLPQTPYQFEFWQYTNTAQIEGVEKVEKGVDLNIQIIKE